ncbi:hypothetical protein AZE42_01175 [Rhizopogon vesiculosus]|uniref:tRNA (guanine(10)-N(2))-methyltransferase n=1 Tax=Rhizopogon vesiculosus TaxID=180088 RepID=A0A1J8Q4N8_9AGAM|nr:hypothetical protein AZE42_01175 [Rhizopogon vesiculosus]
MPSTEYLFVFAQSHEEFRVPELLSISELYGFTIGFNRYANVLEKAVKRPFMILTLDNEEHAKILAQRCIMIKSVHEFYAEGASYDALHEHNCRARPQWERYIPDTSFKFYVLGYNFTISQRCQHEIIESFAYMDFLGKIDMKDPEVTLTVFEEYESDRAPHGELHKYGEFKQVYFGRLIVDGTARALIGTFNVKKRQYFGNTSMEAEISLLMANQTLASPGKLIYDPFIGTGSMAYTTAYFGALVYGSDIDGRQMHKTPGIIRAAAQYGVASRIMDLCTFDVTNHPWRCGSLFDAIITDPPYGVRAGAKRLGRKKLREDRDRFQYASPRPNEPYIPPTKPYELSQLVTDLVHLARYLLRPGGRLVFFLPTVSDEYAPLDVHAMLCDGMELVANSLQDFGSWGRRLITIKKTSLVEYPPPSFDSVRDAEESGDMYVPAHKDFREKYFQGFKKESES